MFLAICPRCGDRGYENLQTYSYCAGCNYSPVLDETYTPAVPDWALEALKGEFISSAEEKPEPDLQAICQKWVS